MTMREFDTMRHYDPFVTLNIFQLIGRSNDGRRQGRGTYLFLLEHVQMTKSA
jgi:hypothetical protein